MNIQKKAQESVRVAHRQPGHVVIGILGEVLSVQRQKQWELNIDEETNKILVHCFRQKGRKAEIVPGVKIKVVEPVDPECMFNHITLELIIEGLINVLSGKKIQEDFDKIKEELKKRFGDCMPYRIFEHQKKSPEV